VKSEECDVAATSGEILRRWSLWGRRPASPPGQSPVGPCPFLNAKSEEWRVKNEERKGLLLFHSTLITLHSSLFTLRILRESTHTRRSNWHLGGTKTPQMYTGG
jgi:hypothetical protein